MFYHTAYNKNGAPVNTQNSSLIGLYFSASWCPPCRAFTPVLTQAYNSWGPEQIEIILVPRDNDVTSFQNYYAKMPWASLAFNPQVSEQLMQQFQCNGIPTLVIMSRGCTQIISTDGWGEVEQQGAGAIYNWLQAAPQQQMQPQSNIGSSQIVVEDGEFYGHQMYVNYDGWVGVAAQGTHSNQNDYCRQWINDNGMLRLSDGQQLYVTESGWVGVTYEGQHTNTENNRRTFYFNNGVLGIEDGRQLYITGGSYSGWLAVGFQDEFTNTEKSRRTFKFVGAN